LITVTLALTIYGTKQPSIGKLPSRLTILSSRASSATLVDGDRSVNCLTLLEAVVARDNLPRSRRSAAKIRCGSRVFTASEIDRLHFSKTI
jgi:hypothetical protein